MKTIVSSKVHWIVGAVTLIIVFSAGFSFYKLNFESQITGFYAIGDVLPTSPFIDRSTLRIGKGGVGYDGQMFLTLSLDPFVTHPQTAKALDHPRYRAGRILFPLTAYLLSGGSPDFVPYTLVFLNGLFIAVMAWLLSRYFDFNESKPFKGLLILCIPGIWTIFAFTTSELMSSMLVIGAYVGYRQKQFWVAGLLAGAACLAKEVTFIFWASCFLVGLIEKNRRFVLSLSLSIIPLVLLRIFLIYRFGTENQSEMFNFSVPLMGHINKIQSFFSGQSINKNEYLYYLVFVAAGVLLFSRLISNFKNRKILFFASLGYLLLYVLSTMQILDYHISYSRVYVMITILALLSTDRGMLKGEKAFWILSGVASLRFVYWFSR